MNKKKRTAIMIGQGGAGKSYIINLLAGKIISISKESADCVT